MQKRADEIMKATVSPSTLRHPDSAIFNDENQGTKKLTLTPNLLRDDANITSPILKSEIIKGRASLERDKPQGAKREDSVLSPQPNSKDTRRLKKGASVLGNLFKKRARRGRKEDEDDVEEWLHGHGDKPSIDSSMSLELTPKESPGGRDEEARKEREESLLREEQKRQQQQRLRQEEQKRQEQIQQEQIQQEKLKQEQLKEQQEQLKQEQLQQEQAQRQQEQQQEQQLQDQRQQDYQQHQQEHREREHREREQREREAQSASVTSAAIRNLESETTQEPASLTRNQLSSAISILPDALRPGPDQAKTRSYGQPIDTRSQMQQGKTPESVKNQVYSPKAYQATTAALVDRSVERLSESPEQITFHDASERPDLVIDTSSGAESNDAGSPINSSPEMIERSSTFETANTSLNPIDTALRGHAMTRTWSDWSLRTYFEDDNDVRDMLIVVQQDKGNVVQQKQHPDISPIFADSTKRLADITRVCHFFPMLITS